MNHMNTSSLDHDTSYDLGFNHGNHDHHEGLPRDRDNELLFATVDMRAYMAGYRNGAIAAYNSKG